MGACDIADSGSESNLHVLGSSVGNYLYLLSGLWWWSLCVSERSEGHSLSAVPCLVARSPVQLVHLGGLSGVGQRLVW